MDNKVFKRFFGEIAESHGFKSLRRGWFQEVSAALIILELQKSNYGNYYEMNLSLYLELPAVGSLAELASFVARNPPDVFRRQPTESSAAFDLDAGIDPLERERQLRQVFTDTVDEIVRGMSSPAGILNLRDAKLIFLRPDVEARLRTK